MLQCGPSVHGNLLWQGENDLGVGTEPGNVVNHSGYACALASTVQDWRTLRSKSNLLVGIFGLAPGGSEGHQSQMAAFRIAQTTSFGSLPSPALEDSFFVPTHDLGDPCNKHSRSEACTGNGKFSYKCPKGQSCDNVTPFRDSRIHSRVKRLVGARAAHSASALLYGSRRPAVGPVLSGCQVDKRTGDIVVQFALERRNTSYAAVSGWRFVLDTPFPTNASYLWSAFEAKVVRNGKSVWVPVNASILHDSNRIILSSQADPMYASTGVRYAWSEQPCCAAINGGQNNGNCAPGSCPLWTVTNDVSTPDRLLPALPFEAAIAADGHCHRRAR